MTAVAAPGRHGGARTSPWGRDAVAGAGALARVILRRDRIWLPGWLYGMAAFVVYIAVAVPRVMSSEADLASVAGIFGDPVGRMLTGPAYGFDAPTYERLLAGGYGLYFLLLIALENILLVSRHTRADEQSGRAELIRAGAVGRAAPLAAVLLVAVGTNVVTGVVVAALAVLVGGFALTGSLLFGASLAAVGLAFAGVAVVTAQLTEFSRSASGLAGAVLGAAFLVRTIGDTQRQGGSWVSWLSPLGWGQQTAPYVLDRWWPLLYPLAMFVVGVTVGASLAARRDVGAGLFAAKPGRPSGSARLGTPIGLAARLQRGLLLGWGVGVIGWGVLFGASVDAVAKVSGDLPAAYAALMGADLVPGYLAFSASWLAYLAAAYGVMAVAGLRAEEEQGRAESVLAGAVSRPAWLGSHLLVVAGGVLALLAVGGLVTGLTSFAVTHHAQDVPDTLVASLNQAAPTLVVVAVTALAFGLAPRIAGALGWTIVGGSVLLGTFGPILKLPEAVLDIVPFRHVARVPVVGVDPLPIAVLLLVAAVAAALGLAAVRRRDIG